MDSPNPPPKVETITKDARGRQVFDRWLYQFWAFVTGGNAADLNTILAIKDFTREPQPVRSTSDTQALLAARSFTPAIQPTTLGADSQRILEGQIFGG